MQRLLRWFVGLVMGLGMVFASWCQPALAASLPGAPTRYYSNSPVVNQLIGNPQVSIMGSYTMGSKWWIGGSYAGIYYPSAQVIPGYKVTLSLESHLYDTLKSEDLGPTNVNVGVVTSSGSVTYVLLNADTTTGSVSFNVPNGTWSGVWVICTHYGSGSSAQYIKLYNVTFNVIPPPAPTGLQAISIDSTSVTLSWNAVSGATSYNVYADGNKVASGVTGSTYKVTGLQPSTKYTFSVSAVGPGGESAASSPINVTTTAPPPPPQPTGLTASNVTYNSVTLTWNAVSGATSYEVWQNGKKIATVTSTQYQVTDLQASTGYSFAVDAVGPGGTSPQSTVFVLTDNAPVTPAPLNVQSAGPLYGTGQIRWDPGPGTPNGTVYYVYQSGRLLGTTTDTSFTLQNYNPNWPYTVSAQAPGWQMSPQVSDSPLKGFGWVFGPADLLNNSVALVISTGSILLLVLVVIFTPRLVQIVRGIYEARERARIIEESYRPTVDIETSDVRPVSTVPVTPVVVSGVDTEASTPVIATAVRTLPVPSSQDIEYPALSNVHTEEVTSRPVSWDGDMSPEDYEYRGSVNRSNPEWRSYDYDYRYDWE